ncbi:MAG: hypothetical protein PF487_01115 [Bacteroidales bacterium]|jgi:hypothetical protein|nr:hypothetical protein [Bacteroidales bacterium]
MKQLEKISKPKTLSEYNNSLLRDDNRLTGKEFRRLRRKNKKKK